MSDASWMIGMDPANRDKAIVAASKAYAHLIAGRRHLIGQRLPLAGMHYDFQKALTELQAAAEGIKEAIRLTETCAARTEETISPAASASAGLDNSAPSVGKDRACSVRYPVHHRDCQQPRDHRLRPCRMEQAVPASTC